MLKTAHLNRQKDNEPRSYSDLRKAAGEKEKEGNWPAAISLYQQCIKRMPKNEFAYNRLMILYRKEKDYKKEAAVVKEAIKVFETLYQSKQKLNKAVTALSKKISKATGLMDKKGIHIFDRGPVGKWKKRLQFINKQLKKGSVTS